MLRKIFGLINIFSLGTYLLVLVHLMLVNLSLSINTMECVHGMVNFEWGTPNRVNVYMLLLEKMTLADRELNRATMPIQCPVIISHIFLMPLVIGLLHGGTVFFCGSWFKTSQVQLLLSSKKSFQNTWYYPFRQEKSQ